MKKKRGLQLTLEVGLHRPTSETSLKWHFADGSDDGQTLNASLAAKVIFQGERPEPSRSMHESPQVGNELIQKYLTRSITVVETRVRTAVAVSKTVWLSALTVEGIWCIVQWVLRILHTFHTRLLYHFSG